MSDLDMAIKLFTCILNCHMTHACMADDNKGVPR